ncbi:MAG: hypothetical protein WCG27_09525 [Pseudomonadota bacterium]
MWKKIDLLTFPQLRFLKTDDKCYFARDYKAGAGFESGETNSLIMNFKKSPLADGKQYRDSAINKFAEEASILFDRNKTTEYFVSAIPSSRIKSDSLYDHRFEDFFNALRSLRPCVSLVGPVENVQTIPASHFGGPRASEAIKANYRWIGFSGSTPERIIIFDDVVTIGTHFRAYSDFLRDNKFQGEIIGVFWAIARSFP